METVIRAPFDVGERREALMRRLTELRSLIPQLQEEKARMEGAILLLDEMSTSPAGGPGPLRAVEPELAGSDEAAE